MGNQDERVGENVRHPDATVPAGRSEQTNPPADRSITQQRGNGDAGMTNDGDASSSSSSSGFHFLSTSIPAPTPLLGPEPVEYSTLGRTEATFSMSSAQMNLSTETSKRDELLSEATETTPLIRQSSGSTSRSSTTAVSVTGTDTATGPGITTAAAAAPACTSPFLGNTSTARFWLILLPVMTTMFIASFDSTIMASSHPAITSHFRAANSASWLSTAFVLTSTAFQPLLGRLSDALGRKPLFVACLAVFGLSTVWCGLATSIKSFIAARAVCGLGAGGATMLGNIIISDLVPIERRGAFQSLTNATWGSGAALGAALGGIMAEALGWRWEFGVQVPPLILCLGIAIVAIPADLGLAKEGRKTLVQAVKEFDTKGSVLLTMAITFFILGLNLGGNVLPWSHPFVIASLVIFATLFPTFLWVESFVDKPIMPLNLIRTAPRANIILGNFLGSLLMNSILFNIPLYFQAVLLLSASGSGLRLMLPFVVTSLVGISTGFTINYTGRLKWPLIVGTVFYVVGTLPLCLLRRDLASVTYLLVLVPSAIGQGFQFPTSFIAALACSAQEEQAVVTSTLVLWRSLGFVLGVASSSLVVQNALVHYLAAFVQGERKADVIAQVRASVEAIAKLEQPYQDQVVRSYEAALRLTFIGCTVLAVLTVLLVIPVKLPRLGQRKQ